MNCKALPNDLDPEYRDVKTQKQSPRSSEVRPTLDTICCTGLQNDAKAACLH